MQRLTPGGLHALENAKWPGNVRELFSVVSRLIDETEENGCITEPRVRRILEERVSSASLSGVGIRERRSFKDLIESGLGYTAITKKLQRELFKEAHMSIANGKRTNEAYERIARVLDCGKTTVKKMLRGEGGDDE